VTGRATLVVTGSDGRGALALAAAVASEAAAASGRAALLAEFGDEARRRPPTLLAAQPSRDLESRLREEGARCSARGHLCHLGAEASGEELERVAVLADACEAELVVVALPPRLWAPALALWRHFDTGRRSGLLVASLPRERSMAALAVAEMRSRGWRARVARSGPSFLAARRALAGLRPGGVAGDRAGRLAVSLLGSRGAARGESGQALPAVLAACAALAGCALVLASIGGAVTGKQRVQRAADLSALSATRAMRDSMPRLLAPARLPDGRVNPRHISRAAYLGGAELAAEEAAEQNGVDPRRLRISFPDSRAMPPLRARVEVRAEIDPAELPGGERLESEAAAGGAAAPEPIPVTAVAVAEAGAGETAAAWTGAEGQATGGGYGGPLVYRNGEGMRPDVGAAYDRMAVAASAAGHSLLVSSGFRSDAEQAALWEAHPDPTWVAPPGQSLHRCATELDLGPATAYGWLAAKATRFGFVQRYSWEPWHYGFDAGPAPCSREGESGGAPSRSPDGAASRDALPAFVPERYRATIERSAARWGVSGAMLAAQLMAESGFDPNAVSPAGAQGIAQFMPGTAASMGLRDPFDPVAAIDAQAHLMSDLLKQLGSIPLALAAYNAGPGAVEPCMCIPPYPETQAYVARILALLKGTGALAAPELEVRLVK